MRKPKASGASRRTTADEKRVEVQWADVDLDELKPAALSLDPALVEHIRSRDRLVQLTVRLGEDQIKEAKRVAATTNEKYQRVLRRWVAEGASRSMTKRRKRAV